VIDVEPGYEYLGYLEVRFEAYTEMVAQIVDVSKKGKIDITSSQEDKAVLRQFAFVQVLPPGHFPSPLL